MMVGCRLELGYSIVLFVRHYSEMVGAPNGNLKFHSVSFYSDHQDLSMR